MTRLWHLTEPATWAAAQAAGSYTGSTRGADLAEVGFVHCSSPAQLPAVVKAVYHDLTADCVILELDARTLEDVGSPVRFEPGDPQDPTSPLFPHVYGPIPTCAVIRTIPARIQRGMLLIDDDGTPRPRQ